MHLSVQAKGKRYEISKNIIEPWSLVGKSIVLLYYS